MQVEMKGTGERQHVSQSVGQTLIAAGLATEVKPVAPKPKPDLKWATKPGVVEGDYQRPPIVQSSCGVCGHKGFTESFKGTAHIHEVRHCGIAEKCPQDVAKKYEELFFAWKSRSRKPVEKISQFTSDAHNARMGVKTKQQLINEALAGVVRPKMPQGE